MASILLSISPCERSGVIGGRSWRDMLDQSVQSSVEMSVSVMVTTTIHLT